MSSNLIYIFYALKLLRLVQIDRIIIETKRFEVVLKKQFTNRLHGIHNFFHAGKTGVLLIFFLHIASCFWMYLGLTETGWAESEGLAQEHDHLHIDELWELYITSVYFVTTTITTVGFGEISGETSSF